MSKSKSRARPFGTTRQLPSKRWQARYWHRGERHTAPVTFDAKQDATAWLGGQRMDILRGAWLPPAVAANADGLTFGDYAATSLAQRKLADRTRHSYEQIMRDHLLPYFGEVPVDAITPARVRTWWAALDTGDTMRARAYGLLTSVMNDAVTDELIASSPCRVKGAATAQPRREVDPASPDQIAAIAAAMPPRYAALVMLSAWCALRFGEVTELRRGDIDLRRREVRIERAAAWVSGRVIVKPPKTNAGKRRVPMPATLAGQLRGHLAEHVGPGKDALLFPSPTNPGRQIAQGSLFKYWSAAVKAAGVPGMRFHDLRHTGATLAAQSGATTAELMHRLGHRSPRAAQIYQHATAERARAVADALDAAMSAGTVVPLRRVV
jgi:integrase